MKWRIIPLHVTNGFTAMAIDEAVSESVKEGSDSTIRFWRWNPSTVSIGYFQGIEDEVNLNECKKNNIDVVRRRTGGGAVYHDYNGEITYSVIGKEEIFPKSIHESYNIICGWVIKGLSNIGIDSKFIPINDIIASGKKISGNAQTRRNGVLLQHGTILYDLDVNKMFSLLKISKEKISDKMIKSVEDRVTKIKNFKNIDIEEAYNAIMKGFTINKEFYIGKLTNEEINRAKELASEKYSSKKWNYMR